MTGILAIPGLLLLLGLLSGCQPAGSSGNDADTSSRNAAHQKGTVQECENLLDDSFAMVQPDQLGITSDRELAASILNQWLTMCSTWRPEEALPATTDEFLGGLLDPEEFEQATGPHFTERAPGHLRNCLLAKQTAEFAGRDAENDLQRTVRLFNYVCRNVALIPESDALPLTPFEILLFGRGTAADRAWVFAELLRQLRIDAVIVRPDEARPEQSPGPRDRRWLTGVLLGGKVYLFDARLGLPVPAADDPGTGPLVRRPAALSEVLANGELLRRLDGGPGRAYPLAAEDLRNVRIELIGERSLYIPRMKVLQGALSGRRSVIVHESLEDDSFGPGLLNRVDEAFGAHWSRDEAVIWPHPERSAGGFEQIREDKPQELRVRLQPFQAPVPLADPTRNAQGAPVEMKQAGPAERRQLKTRVAQLLGDYTTALSRYNGIRDYANKVSRIPRSIRLPPATRQMHARAAEDAYYWSCVCQIEQGKDRVAAHRLQAYLRRPGDLAWEVPARGLLAISLARQGALDRAVSTLQAVPEQHVQWDGYQVLIRRWRSLQTEDDAAPGESSRTDSRAAETPAETQ